MNLSVDDEPLFSTGSSGLRHLRHHLNLPTLVFYLSSCRAVCSFESCFKSIFGMRPSTNKYMTLISVSFSKKTLQFNIKSLVTFCLLLNFQS